MPAMTHEQRRALAAFLREHMKLIAENLALRAILDSNAAHEQAPVDWQDNLEQLRQTPEYRAIVEDFEPQIAQIERGDAESDLIESLQRLLGGRAVN
jgi:lipopolysaccharide biosynthesis regulator YciM